MTGVRPFSVAHRADDIADATGDVVDVLVVGGGATGAGVALDAASRGLSVVLVEKGDLASGTSSKSSKLVHGGLRYLEQYDFGLVYEGVNERDVLQKIAPHLVRPMDFVFPIFPDTARARLVRVGLTAYDVLAGLRNVRRHERLTAIEAVGLAPALATSGLSKAYVYGDCATDDARLVLAITHAARRFGATVLTYAEVTGLLRDDAGQVRGARVRDCLDGAVEAGGEWEVRARHVVNATGVWVDNLLGMADPAAARTVQPSKGIHVVLDAARLPLAASVILPSKQGDGRVLFAIPWGRQVVLGTTDTAYDGPLDEVSIEQHDVDYVLAAANTVFLAGLDEDDIVAGWAGCRPLLKGDGESMSDLSRRHALTEGPGGMLTITGGKLTTYRRMAKDVVDRIVARDGRRARSRTDEIPLGCARPYADVVADMTAAAVAVGVAGDPAEVGTLLVQQYGEAAASVLALAASTGLVEPLSPAAAHVEAEVAYAARHEGAATLEDVLSRRTRLALRARDAALPAAPSVAALLARELGRSPAWADAQVEAYAAAVRRERGVLGLPA